MQVRTVLTGREAGSKSLWHLVSASNALEKPRIWIGLFSLVDSPPCSAGFPDCTA